MLSLKDAEIFYNTLIIKLTKRLSDVDKPLYCLYLSSIIIRNITQRFDKTNPLGLIKEQFELGESNLTLQNSPLVVIDMNLSQVEGDEDSKPKF